MSEPAYVALAGEYARRIRAGELPPGVQLPSYSEIAQRHRVSDVVVRKAIELLQMQGIVRSVRRRGIFVADQPNLVRISPERQMEHPVEAFRNESGRETAVDFDSSKIASPSDLAEEFGIQEGAAIKHTVTKASEDARPISISDTYQPLDVIDASNATLLEETVADRIPSPSHAQWLETTPGDLVKAVRQRYFDAQGRLIMVSDVSYPRDRYDAFVFRMPLKAGVVVAHSH